MSQRTRAVALLGSVLAVSMSLVAAGPSAAPTRSDDPLDMPARVSTLATSSVLVGLTRIPDGGWVAVGRLGHVLRSEDGAKWQQVTSVPVSTDLVSVKFVDREYGWAVGHGGVILATQDGGRHWVKQLDGREAAKQLVAYWKSRAANPGQPPEPGSPLDDAQAFQDAGPGRPFLDVWFADRQRGYAVGAFGLLFATEDGGRTWAPKPELLSNPQGQHLNAIMSVDRALVIAGEQGLFARYDEAKGVFERVATPYPGSFFGVVGQGLTILLFGLGGNVVRSTDAGKTWAQVQSMLNGTISSAVTLADGRFVLASQSGEVAISADDGLRFAKLAKGARTPIFGVSAAGNDQLIAVGLRGVSSLPLPIGGKATTHAR